MEKDFELRTIKCPKCGHWMRGDECGTCINMPDEELRKYAEMIADHYQCWGSPTYTTYDILKKLASSLLSEKEKRLKLAEQEILTIKFTIIQTIKGTVEGYPTSEINYLQRLRELVAKEERIKELEEKIKKISQIIQYGNPKITE